MSQFDTRFTKQTPIDSPDDSTLSESANMVFQVSVTYIVIDFGLKNDDMNILN